MDVRLINSTADAVNLLLYTKSTRLTLGIGTREKIAAMTDEEKDVELQAMARTIPSSWEFINYTFEITGASRGFTHQFVRTRTGKYAQQTMRVLDVSGFEYVTGPSMKKPGMAAAQAIYDTTMGHINDAYKSLLRLDTPVEDARGILPTNICTNIIAQFDLRTLADLARKRVGGRVQKEYRDVLEMMFNRVLEVHPWATYFLFPRGRGSFSKVEEFIAKFKEKDPEGAVEALKDIDLARKEIG